MLSSPQPAQKNREILGKLVRIAIAPLLLSIPSVISAEAVSTGSADYGCLKCHAGIESIRPPETKMMQGIRELAAKAGYEDVDCIVCHGGNPMAQKAKSAHQGTVPYFIENEGPKNFYPDPGSPWINQHTCGVCHMDYVKTQRTSLMFTEAGKIQGTQWGFGALNGMKHDWANFETQEMSEEERLGTDIYKTYMQRLREAEPQVFPESMSVVPEAPSSQEVHDDPRKAAFTYLRQECQRCHLGGKGREKPGEYRGIGCSACHIPYSSQGLYEGNDASIADTPGHLLSHQMQSGRASPVEHHGARYTGVPVRSCVTCHNRGRRIGTSFYGLMETAYSSPFMAGGENQAKTFGKNYLHLHADIHKDKGMLCQDCHTSLDLHSDGNLTGTTLAPVEIECQDCHGTPLRQPWELPLGYGDEIANDVPMKGDPRGLSQTLTPNLATYGKSPFHDGYLLSARGNPMPHVKKKGDMIVLESSGGRDIVFQSLKSLNENDLLSTEGRVAMVNVGRHIDTMECYACHDDWAPQCYGCHIKIDYSAKARGEDWVHLSNEIDEHGLNASDSKKEFLNHGLKGQVSEQRSYLRFENPPLVVNGEGRIAPAIPGCQTTVTIIEENGNPLLTNHIFKIPNIEGKGAEGQKGLDMAPTHTHTVSKSGRTCESCHTNPAAMGYGIDSGATFADPSKPYAIDLSDAEGKVIPKTSPTQINAIEGLDHDWSRFVTEAGEQLQSVGHHFSKSRPLNNEERSRLDRRHVCISCHESIPDGDLAVTILEHLKETAGVQVDKEKHREILNFDIRLAGWLKVLLPVFLFFAFILWMYRFPRAASQ